mmetsp:Transcript_33564/g.72721  ORF Transcript_33564/g.72721 Transcript_33564/m.72721 type:complete len:287 (+) Transcript_33564:639-1499(+)
MAFARAIKASVAAASPAAAASSELLLPLLVPVLQLQSYSSSLPLLPGRQLHATLEASAVVLAMLLLLLLLRGAWLLAIEPCLRSTGGWWGRLLRLLGLLQPAEGWSGSGRLRGGGHWLRLLPRPGLLLLLLLLLLRLLPRILLLLRLLLSWRLLLLWLLPRILGLLSRLSLWCWWCLLSLPGILRLLGLLLLLWLLGLLLLPGVLGLRRGWRCRGCLGCLGCLECLGSLRLCCLHPRGNCLGSIEDWWRCRLLSRHLDPRPDDGRPCHWGSRSTTWRCDWRRGSRG